MGKFGKEAHFWVPVSICMQIVISIIQYSQSVCIMRNRVLFCLAAMQCLLTCIGSAVNVMVFFKPGIGVGFFLKI